MWSALIGLRRSTYVEYGAADRTMDALASRGMVDYALFDVEDEFGTREYCITHLGRCVADAYAEGQEAKA